MKSKLRRGLLAVVIMAASVGVSAAPAAAALPWYQTNAESCVTEHGGKSGWRGYYMKFTNNCGDTVISRLDCPWYSGGDRKMTVKAGETKIWGGCGGFTPHNAYYGFQ